VPRFSPAQVFTSGRQRYAGCNGILTTVPTGLGFWVSWLPFALPQVWPFCCWLAVAVDHFSRRMMGFAVYRSLPSSAAVRRYLEEIFRKAGKRPAHIISDQGTQFTEKGFRRWCRRRGIQHRFGALGKYVSLAVIERAIRTIKNECTRRLILVPHRLAAVEGELAYYVNWYNSHRPHGWLYGATPRFEPRPRWPCVHAAPRPKFSSAAGRESGSSWQFNSNAGGDISRS
jgi:transposase InsO family protein